MEIFENYISYLEKMMKDLSSYEKKGLDTSSLRLFIKNLKTFQKLKMFENSKFNQNLSFEEKLEIIKSFLEDRKAFPRIKDVIDFANEKLSLGFLDQKEARVVTIKRIIGRIHDTPDLKEKVKYAVIEIRNQNAHTTKMKSKKDLESAESFSKWAEILRNL